jgi:5-methylcytosine-specific restriction endonuclease McrA
MLAGDPIVHVDIFERDEWICGLCHDPIDKWRRGPDDWYRATLDHIIPLSKGGLHTYENTQAAHWICNMEKGDRLTFGGDAGRVEA